MEGKTALQQAIEDINELNSPNPIVEMAFKLIVDVLREKLQTEKQQIVEAYGDGGEQYYKSKYGRQ